MNELEEGLKTISNLVAVAQLVIENDRQELLPTVLETIFEEVQKVVFPYCKVDE